MINTRREFAAPVGVSRVLCAWDWLMILIVFLCATPGCQTVTNETLNQEIVDAAITSAVKTRILTDPVAGLGGINVESVKNRVYLTGIVPTIEDKRRAHEVAIEVPGVISVVNDLQVREEPNL
jgi:hyperosmotically inducible periplasmic protein